MTKVRMPMLFLTATGKVTQPIDDSDFTFRPEIFVGLENEAAILQEYNKRTELEWGFRAIYREKPLPEGRRTIRQKYFVPTNPQTTIQQLNRTKFADAVASWQTLTPQQMTLWNKLEYPAHMSGYNRFLRNFMNTP